MAAGVALGRGFAGGLTKSDLSISIEIFARRILPFDSAAVTDYVDVVYRRRASGRNSESTLVSSSVLIGAVLARAPGLWGQFVDDSGPLKPLARIVPWKAGNGSLKVRAPLPGAPKLQRVPLPPPIPLRGDIVKLLMEERQSDR